MLRVTIIDILVLQCPVLRGSKVVDIFALNFIIIIILPDVTKAFPNMRLKMS